MKLSYPLGLGLGTLCTMLLLPVVQAQETDAGYNQHPPGAFVAGHRPPPFAGRRGPRQPRGTPEQIIDSMDTDGDGAVSEAEFVDARLIRIESHFDRLDRDDDGLISLDESERPAFPPGLRPAFRRGLPHRPGRPAGEELDREEVIACVRETIAEHYPPANEAIEERFDNVDTNGDGFLDLNEVSTAMQARAAELFARLDIDGDGLLTLEELTTDLDNAVNVRRVLHACIQQLSAAGDE